MQHYSLKIWIEIYANCGISLSSLNYPLSVNLFWSSSPYFSTEFEAMKINIWIFSRDLFCTGIFDSRRESHIKYWSSKSILVLIDPVTCFFDFQKSMSIDVYMWYISFQFSRNSTSFFLSLFLSLSVRCLVRE